MLTNNKLKFILEESEKISGYGLAVYDAKGKEIVSGENYKNKKDPKIILSFLESNSESAIIGNQTMIRILIKEETVIVLALDTKKPEANIVGRLIASEIKNIAELVMFRYSKEDFLKDILGKKVSDSEIASLSKNLGMQYSQTRVVYVLEIKLSAFIMAKETVLNLIDLKHDNLLEIQGNRLVLLKRILKNGKFNEVVFAAAFRIRFRQRHDKNSDRISNRIDNLSQFLRAYEEADTAFGWERFFVKRIMCFFEKLGMGRLISQLAGGCVKFSLKKFENKMPDFEDEETSTY
jgi:carbohydrate diacid regulator